MVDFLSPDERRQRMARVRSKNSKAELIVFSYLRKHGIYHQRHYSGAPGTPDIAKPRKKKAVFIDGDFWHGRTMPKLLKQYGADSFWVNKIQANVERDNRQREELMKAGWEVLIVWESDINRKRTQEEAIRQITDFLNS